MQSGLMTKAMEHMMYAQFNEASLRLKRDGDWCEQKYNAELLSGDGRVLAKFQVSGSLYDTWVGFSYNGDEYDVNIFNGRVFLNVDEDFVAAIYHVRNGLTDTLVSKLIIKVEVI